MWWMPPSAFRSRNAAMGDPSPKGSRSSTLVFGRVTKTTVTPCSGCGTGAETSPPSVSRYTALARARSFTAIATWLRRPIMVVPSGVSWRSYLDDHDVTGGLFAPDLVHGRAHRAVDGVLDELGVAALLPRESVHGVRHRIGDEVDQERSLARLLGQAHDLDNGVAGDLALAVDRDSDGHHARDGELAPLGHGALARRRDEVAILVQAS